MRIPLGRDASGTRKYHSRTVRGSYADAEQYLEEALSRLDLLDEPLDQRLDFEWSDVQALLHASQRMGGDSELAASLRNIARRVALRLPKNQRPPEIRRLHYQRRRTELPPVGENGFGVEG